MSSQYKMTISRLTIDKLGVKLYDKVSAVIAELVSNSYDADATKVTVSAPLGTYLATKSEGKVIDKNLEIEVEDNGIGMTPDEINDFYLRVGAERRNDNRRGRGNVTQKYKRRVLGRKGVGKLAPFGICEVIEIVTSGGEELSRINSDCQPETGYLTAHFILDRNEILKDTDFDYIPRTGELDRSLRRSTGTTIKLKRFAFRRVSALPVFGRQLSQRFGLPSSDWSLWIRDTSKSENDEDFEQLVGKFSVTTMPNTKIRFAGPSGLNFSTEDGTPYEAYDPTDQILKGIKAGFDHDGHFFPIVGWAAYSKEPYRDDLMAGIRIYCRGKIAAQTAVFNRTAGFQGEHTIRSYLVGELHADWLDEDEDLIQTDRRDILWSHELGQCFQLWGQKLIKEIGSFSRKPIRQSVWDRFREISGIDERILDEFPGNDQKAIRDQARELGGLVGRSMRHDEVEEESVVEHMVQLVLTLAPHVTLDETLREAADAEETPIAVMSTILRTARLAELSSFGRIAQDRLRVIERVASLKDEPDTAEATLQELLEFAPWLIDPQWAPVTANQSFSTLKTEFEKFYKTRTGQDISLTNFSESGRRPDFVLSSQDNGLQIIEIKKPHHKLVNDEMDRIITYYDTMKEFLETPSNRQFKEIFRSFHMTLVCDELGLLGAQKTSFESYLRRNKLTHINWRTFLLRTKQMHRDFLNEADRQRQKFGS